METFCKAEKSARICFNTSCTVQSEFKGTSPPSSVSLRSLAVPLEYSHTISSILQPGWMLNPAGKQLWERRGAALGGRVTERLGKSPIRL
jgi:hypothetical protein